MRKLGTFAVSIVVMAAFAACSKKTADGLPKPEPTPLLKPAMSYWNFEHTRRELKFDRWDTVEDRQPLVSDRRPPFRLLVIRVPEFNDHGTTGSLVLWFYNDRLMRTQFYAPNIKQFVNTSDQQLSLSNDMTGGIPPHTRVWVGKEGDGKTYLGMMDEVLKQQMDDWVARYSGG
jgi:hypothetical protein